MNFVAIDFETANYQPDSACAVGLVKVVGGEIVDKAVHLIRPPTKQFVFTYVHGLTWKDVAKSDDFGTLWPKLEPFLEGAQFLAAHNASFDKGVLHACCAGYGYAHRRCPFAAPCRFLDAPGTSIPPSCPTSAASSRSCSTTTKRCPMRWPARRSFSRLTRSRGAAGPAGRAPTRREPSNLRRDRRRADRASAPAGSADKRSQHGCDTFFRKTENHVTYRSSARRCASAGAATTRAELRLGGFENGEIAVAAAKPLISLKTAKEFVWKSLEKLGKVWNFLGKSLDFLGKAWKSLLPPTRRARPTKSCTTAEWNFRPPSPTSRAGLLHSMISGDN